MEILSVKFSVWGKSGYILNEEYADLRSQELKYGRPWLYRLVGAKVLSAVLARGS